MLIASYFGIFQKYCKFLMKNLATLKQLFSGLVEAVFELNTYSIFVLGSTQVVADEVYYFKKAIKPQKEPSSVLIPQVGQTSMMDVDNEDSMDAPSVGSTDSPMPGTQSTKKV